MSEASSKARNKALQGKIALVAGATRGAGRGIAIALGEAGATVYCTGRSSRRSGPATLSGEARNSKARPETIEETAELVTAAGGNGIAVRVDHTEPAQVKKLVARIKRQHKGLDILEGEPRQWPADAQAGGSLAHHHFPLRSPADARPQGRNYFRDHRR